MIPQKKTKFNQLVDEINNFAANNPDGLDPFTLQRYKFEAKKLLQVNQGEAFSILGILACLSGNVEEMRNYHLNSMKYGTDPCLSYNYSSSLASMGFFEEAYEYASKAYSEAVGNIEYLIRAIDLATYLEKEEELKKYLATYKKLTGQSINMLHFPEDDPEVLKYMLDEFGGMIKNHPDLLITPDDALNSLIDELVDGVELD